MVVILTIEISRASGYRSVWSECDSTLLWQAFSSPLIVTWTLRGRWRTCMHICGKITMMISWLIIGLNKIGFKWFSCLPTFISLEFLHNRFQIPLFPFV